MKFYEDTGHKVYNLPQVWDIIHTGQCTGISTNCPFISKKYVKKNKLTNLPNC